jgi:(p)ppGpp synthase/HD superfamily hydrolase
MFAHAQTNIQLFNQLERAGYGHADLARVRDAYALSMRLFTGCFRRCGKTFISHLVGTASILADLHTEAPIVAAGLLHSAYSHGEFGTGARGASEAKRRQVRLVVGERAEVLVARYTSMPWHGEAIPDPHQNLPAVGSIERELLLMRLANELEDHLDLGGLYSGETRRRREIIQSYLFLCTGMAERLGYPELSTALSRAFEDTLSVELPEDLQQENENLTNKEAVGLIGWNSCFLLPPATHSLRLKVRLRRILRRRSLAGAIRFVFSR